MVLRLSRKDTKGRPIDYEAAIDGGLWFVRDGAARALLAVDYRQMVEDGLLPDEAESFGGLTDRCRQVAERANTVSRSNKLGCAMAAESKEQSSEDHLIGPSVDGKTNDLLATLNVKDGRSIRVAVPKGIRFGAILVKRLVFPAGGQERLIHLDWSPRHLRGSWMRYP